MTPEELLSKIGKPTARFAISKCRTAVAVWHEGAWVMFAGLLLNGNWGKIGNLIVDGKPVIADWTEYHPAA